MRTIARGILLFGVVLAALAYATSAIREQQRLDRLTAERDAAAEQNRLNFIEFERHKRAIPAPRPMGKPLPGQRDA